MKKTDVQKLIIRNLASVRRIGKCDWFDRSWEIDEVMFEGKTFYDVDVYKMGDGDFIASAKLGPSKKDRRGYGKRYGRAMDAVKVWCQQDSG